MTNEERIRELLKNAEKFDGLSFIKERIANREQLRKEKREKLKELMTNEIIYTEDYALIVSDKQAKENDWGYIPFEGGQVKLIGKFFADDWRKVIGHRPLKDAPILEGVDLINETYGGNK